MWRHGELHVKVELWAGIRDDATVERAPSTSCARDNLATAALEDPGQAIPQVRVLGQIRDWP